MHIAADLSHLVRAHYLSIDCDGAADGDWTVDMASLRQHKGTEEQEWSGKGANAEREKKLQKEGKGTLEAARAGSERQSILLIGQ